MAALNPIQQTQYYLLLVRVYDTYIYSSIYNTYMQYIVSFISEVTCIIHMTSTYYIIKQQRLLLSVAPTHISTYSSHQWFIYMFMYHIIYTSSLDWLIPFCHTVPKTPLARRPASWIQSTPNAERSGRGVGGWQRWEKACLRQPTPVLCPTSRLSLLTLSLPHCTQNPNTTQFLRRFVPSNNRSAA